ncbi:hypothetical protein [Oligosphaera ethanolica]|uniref:Uncharacterized protein n=1 Tax=Oligosphaera ethanolica TaxID=760260 RepID=A0AAE3VCC6_9BACT|nr:hypothetical protein [Oligosphaera ethanolica]MDQ0287897.1 hypothetical protein [Oligosphaera ethanolica]
MQETHGPPPPNHPTLISADLCGSVFHRSVHPGREFTGDNLQVTHGQSSPSYSTLIPPTFAAAGFIGAIDTNFSCSLLFSAPKARPKIAQGKRPQGAPPWVGGPPEMSPEGRPKKTVMCEIL